MSFNTFNPTFNTGNTNPPIVTSREVANEVITLKDLFLKQPAVARLKLDNMLAEVKMDNIRNLESIAVRVDQLNQKFAVIKSKIERLEHVSESSSSYGSRLNEIAFLLQEVCQLLAELDTATTSMLSNFEKNSNLIVYDDATIERIELIKNQMVIFRQKKRTFEQFIEEAGKRLTTLSAGRVEMDGSHPVDWDESLTCYQNTSIGLGHILIIKQTWKNDGYSIGDVEGSVVLQPMQIKQVASIDWTRKDYASRSEGGQQGESLSNSITRESDVQEIIKTALDEVLSGNSNVLTKSSSMAMGASASGPIGGAVLGVSGSYQSSKTQTNSSAGQNGNRQLAANSLQSLRDRIQQSASSLRSQRNTVIQTVSQEESATVTTEVIANYNRRHALTTMWFSINRHFVVEQEVADVQECLFFPMPMSPFDMAKIYRWRDILQSGLMDRQHLEAFDAIERMVDGYVNMTVPNARYCDEQITYIEGELQISFEIPRIPDPEEAELAAAIAANDSERIGIATGRINDEIDRLYYPFSFLLRRKFADKRDAYLTKIKNEDKAKRDYVYEKEIVPVMVESLVDEHLYLHANDSSSNLEADFTLVDKYDSKVVLRNNFNGSRVTYSSPKGRPLRVKFKVRNIGKTRAELTGLNLHLTTLDPLPDGVRVILHSASIHYYTAFGKYRLFSSSQVSDDVTDGAYLDTSRMSNAEMQEPKKEDTMKAARLISHLNQHIEKYHGMIWMGMDTNRLFSLMDGYVAPNSGGRSVASVVDAQPIGVVGNNIVLKVVPGANLDPYYRINLEAGATLLDQYKPETPSEPFRITVKNPGLYGESILGKCESAETIDDSKLWRYEDLKIPYLPAEIQPVSLESRYHDPGNLQTKDYAQPMINMQTLTPDTLRESSLKQAIDLMGKGDLFRDVTGLQGSQELAKNAQNQSTQVLKNAADAASSALQTGANYAIEKQKQDLEVYKELYKNASPAQQEQLRAAMMESMAGNNEIFAKALENTNEISKSQAKSAAEASASDTLSKIKAFVGSGTTMDRIRVNPDGSFEAEGLTTNNEDLKAWVTNNSSTLLEIARDYDLKQAGKPDKTNVCWAYALALTLFPAYNWSSEKGNEAIIEEMLAMIDGASPVIDPNEGSEVDLGSDEGEEEA